MATSTTASVRHMYCVPNTLPICLLEVKEGSYHRYTYTITYTHHTPHHYTTHPHILTPHTTTPHPHTKHTRDFACTNQHQM